MKNTSQKHTLFFVICLKIERERVYVDERKRGGEREESRGERGEERGERRLVRGISVPILSK
jgi:hypothetical protein